MKVAIEGCCHGELDSIYQSILLLKLNNNIAIDLLLICGDFQANRNNTDLNSMACPSKYRTINTFYKYYNGEKIAPVLTLVIGGNHESANYFYELRYGGWLAPNIYYIGNANIVNYGGLRISGISGIYHEYNFKKGHFEKPIFTESTMRSFYNIREYEIEQLKMIKSNIDIFLSHEWPNSIYNYGDKKALLKIKPFLKDECDKNTLGCTYFMDLLKQIKPKYWFSAHMHVKFAAIVNHNENDNTKFLALDKCLPNRDFLQVLDFDATGELILKYDPEWLAILKSTHNKLNTTPYEHVTELNPPSDNDLSWIKDNISNLIIPENFVMTVNPYQANLDLPEINNLQNPQTLKFLDMLELKDNL